MALTEEQDKHLTELLDDLKAVSDDIYPNGQKFVLEQVARHEQYGARMFLSPKQLAWLESLHGEFCQQKPKSDLVKKGAGGAPPGERPEEGDDDTAPRDDMGDEIPF